jgi:hypothetical protein
MVKTKGVTLVALATLLAGFVASCSSADAPSAADLQSPPVTIEIVAEDEPPALTSSPVALDRVIATAPPAPSSTPVPTRTLTPTSTVAPSSIPAPHSDPTATTRPQPTPVPEVVIYDVRPDAGTYSGPTLITIDWKLPSGAAIYYTLDGSTPTKQNGTLYEGEFEIYDDAQVMALVILESGTVGAIASSQYTIEKPPLDSPSIELIGGVYIGDQLVVIENNEPGSDLIYTLDGTAPSTTNGKVYSGPITISASTPTNLKVIASRPGFIDSDEQHEIYRVLGTFEESSTPIVLSGDDVLEITDTHFLHRGDITLSGNAKLIITDSILEHVKDFTFEHELKATENSEVIVTNSGIGSSCTGSFNWAFFDNAKLTANGMDPTHSQCNTWNFMSGSSVIDVTDWESFSGTVCDQTSVEIHDSDKMEIELCMPWPTVMDTELPLEFDEYIFDPGANSTMEFALSMFNSTVEGWGINVGPGSDITIRNTPSITVGVGIGFPSQNETMIAEGIHAGLWEDQSWDFGAGAKLRLINTFTYGWEINAWGGNTIVIRDSDYSGSSVNGSDSHYLIENTTADLLVAFEQVEMTVINSVITGNVVANDDTVITLIDSVVGDESGEASSTNVYAYGNGKVILRNTTVLGEQITEGNGEIVVEVP